MQLKGLQECTFPINLTAVNSPTDMFTSDDANRRLVPVFNISSTTADCSQVLLCIRIIPYFQCAVHKGVYHLFFPRGKYTQNMNSSPSLESINLSAPYKVTERRLASHFPAKSFVCSKCGQNNLFTRIPFRQSPVIHSK